MARLPQITCPTCQQRIMGDEFTPNPQGGAHKASSFDSCLRRCEECGIGFSNTIQIQKVVRIYRSPLDGVPTAVRHGLLETIPLAMNVQNRPSKFVSLCSENSEDAITWTLFTELRRGCQLRSILSKLGCHFAATASVEPQLLLWGVPVPLNDPGAEEVHNRLIEIANNLGEAEQSRSEPDVVLDFANSGVVFIEVKHGSPNDKKTADYRGWTKYFAQTQAFRSAEGIRETGLYELARNWRFAWELAAGRPVSLINLGPADLLDSVVLDRFADNLSQDTIRQFQKLSWNAFRAALTSEPEWLRQFLNARSIG